MLNYMALHGEEGNFTTACSRATAWVAPRCATA